LLTNRDEEERWRQVLEKFQGSSGGQMKVGKRGKGGGRESIGVEGDPITSTYVKKASTRKAMDAKLTGRGIVERSLRG